MRVWSADTAIRLLSIIANDNPYRRAIWMPVGQQRAWLPGVHGYLGGRGPLRPEAWLNRPRQITEPWMDQPSLS